MGRSKLFSRRVDARRADSSPWQMKIVDSTSQDLRTGSTGVPDRANPIARAWLLRLGGPAVIVAFYITALVLVPPRGEFPVCDDWDYYATVGDLLKYGEIRLSDWPAMTLVGQIFWGGLFAKLFGLSYMTLRYSVLTLFLAGALALYGWARTIGRDRTEALFLGLLWTTCPLI